MEYANVIEWLPRWETGAPMPHVFSNGMKVFLMYIIQNSDFGADGKEDWALVEFSGHTFRFGIANDEVFSGLPLFKKGLEAYEAHIIENSSWIQEIKSIHKIHPYYDELRWSDKKHYALLFHDEILEVIAEGYTIESFNMTFEEITAQVLKRMR